MLVCVTHLVNVSTSYTVSSTPRERTSERARKRDYRMLTSDIYMRLPRCPAAKENNKRKRELNYYIVNTAVNC